VVLTLASVSHPRVDREAWVRCSHYVGEEKDWSWYGVLDLDCWPEMRCGSDLKPAAALNKFEGPEGLVSMKVGHGRRYVSLVVVSRRRGLALLQGCNAPFLARRILRVVSREQ
jgi:hypothetical protein